MPKEPSLWRRLVGLFVLSGMLPLLGGGTAAIWLVWKHTHNEAQAKHLILAESLAFQIRETLRAHEVALAHLANILSEPDSEPGFKEAMIMDHMEALAAQGVRIQSFATLDRKGRVIDVYPKHAEPFRLGLSNRPELQKAMETGRPAYSTVQIPPGFMEPMVSVAIPRGSTMTLGLIPLGPLNNRIQMLSAHGEAMRLILTDSAGVAISHKDPLVVAERLNLGGLPPISMVLEGSDGKTSFQEGRQTWIGGATKVPELDWPVAVIESESHVMASTRGLIAALLIAVAGGLVLSMVMAFLLGQKFLGPLRLLTGAFTRISQGRYWEKISPPGFRELGGLHRALEKMVDEIQKREEALGEAAKTWQRTFDSVPDPIWLMDSEQRILRVNQAGSLLLGLKERELVGKHCFQLVHGTDSPPVGCPHLMTMKSGEVHTFEKTGLGKTLLVTTAPIKDSSGNVTGCVHLAKDITERKQMEEELRQSEERYRLVVENAQDAILVAQDGFIKFVNPRMLDLIGFSKEELTTRPFSEFISPEDRPMVMERYKRRLQGDKTLPRAYRFRVLRAANEIRWVEIRAVPILWEGRQAILNFLTDITEKLQSEEALRQSEERYRSLVENSPDGIFMAEIPSTRVTFVNRSICEIMGYSPQEALRLQIWDVLPQEEIPRLRSLLGEVLDGKPLPQGPISVKALRKNGSEISLEVRVAFVYYQGRQVLQAVVRDVTEQELLQKQLQHSQRMQALGTLAGGVAHEFNNLLASIQGFAELLRFTVQEGQEGSEYISEIISSCERAGNLTARMLSLARVEAGERYPVKVNQIIDSTQRLLSQTLPPSINVEVNLKGGLPFVMADPTQLEQVLLNLALNARDAMPQGGTIRFKSGLNVSDAELRSRYPYIPSGSFVEISVEDQGVGIPKEHLERVFEPFFTTKEAGKGTGLGLSVSYSIIKAHNGFILAQSPPPGKEKGSLFRVLLPPAEITQEPPSRRHQEVPAPLGSGERVLVADDEIRIREILKKALETHGYRVETVPDGEKAVSAYLQAMNSGEPFQAVILDLAMPVRDGKWAMARILESNPQANVIVATGYTEEQFLGQEADLKAMAVLRKPFDISILLKTLRDILGDPQEN